MKAKSYATLKRKLDKIFSEYVRRIDADRNGNVFCYTCEIPMHWKSSHAGHWIPRNHLATRWHEDNVRVQCPACNLFRKGQPHIFARNLMSEFGPPIIDRLIGLSKKSIKLTRADLQEMIDGYTQKLKALA